MLRTGCIYCPPLTTAPPLMHNTHLSLTSALYLLAALALASCSPSKQTTPPPVTAFSQPAIQPYTIEAGDTLRFDFAHHPELNRSVVVRPDSMVTLPLIGDVLTGGMQPQKLAYHATRRYSKVIKHPKLTVSIDKSPNQVVYVGGEVKNPGMYPITNGKTALQLILQAGGATREASLANVYIIRDRGIRQPSFLALNLCNNLRESQGIGDSRLQAKDMLVVSKSGIATANQFVDQYINELIPFSKSLGVSYFIGSGIE
jgi:protein involved in polysaccharide export with SLBB domain